jgi:hypothetical protein
MKDNECQLTVEPLYQCCCNCVYLRAVHYHCTTDPKPSQPELDAAGITGRCVCRVQKGWACCAPEFDRVYDNWQQHSCGCELYTQKSQS